MSDRFISGMYTPLFRVLWGDGSPCFYFGKEHRSLYVCLEPALHRGWKSDPKVFWNKQGWEYRQPVLFIGNQNTGKSKIINFPELLIPAGLWRRWFYFRYPEMKDDKPEVKL